MDEAAATVVRGSPAAALRGLVLSYTGFRFGAVAPRTRWELPCGTVTLLLGFDRPVELRPASRAGAGTGGRHTSMVAGLRTTATIGRHHGHLHGMEIVLHPQAAHRLLRLPMHQLADSFVPLDALLGAEGNRLLEQLHALPAWTRRFALLDRYLARQLGRGPEPSPSVSHALRRLMAEPSLRVGALADELGWSERHLRTVFRAEVGLAPKALARVHRLQGVVRSSLRDVSWADSAAHWGFQDQSHLANEFKAMTGLTPTQFTRLRRGEQPGATVDRLPDLATSLLLGHRGVAASRPSAARPTRTTGH